MGLFLFRVHELRTFMGVYMWTMVKQKRPCRSDGASTFYSLISSYHGLILVVFIHDFLIHLIQVSSSVANMLHLKNKAPSKTYPPTKKIQYPSTLRIISIIIIFIFLSNKKLKRTARLLTLDSIWVYCSLII